MKIVLPFPLDELELVLSDVSEEKTIIDPETFCYFRDKILTENLDKFIERNDPGKIKRKAELNISGSRWRRRKLKEFTGSAKECELALECYSIRQKYYPKYAKIRDKFYLYKGNIYMYEFMGFMNVGAEIQLMKLDKKDIVFALNNPKKI